MCGIFVSYNNSSSASLILNGLKKLEYRGYDSWGIAILDEKGRILLEKHIGKIGSATTSLPEARIGIGHTRWATHGGVTDINAHPHLDCTGTLAVLHNGIIENFQTLKQMLISKGHTFTSETDTEIIAHLVEEYAKTETIEKAVSFAFRELVGSNAVVVMDGKTQSVIACRNGSPLVAGVKQSSYYLASDSTALIDKTKSIYYIEDGEGILFSSSGLQIFSLSSLKKKHPQFTTVDWKVESAEKGDYPHFLIKEIHEQARTIPHIFSLPSPQFEKANNLLSKAKSVILTGCGTAYHCALAGTYLFAKNKVRAQALGAYEIAPFLNQISKEDVVIGVSQSGETADILTSVKQVKKNGTPTIGVINAQKSSLERLVDMTISVDAGPEIAVVSTKAFTAQLSALYRLSHLESSPNRIGQDLKSGLSDLLSQKNIDHILEIVRTIEKQDHMFVIGKHLLYPGALEFALKIKETSYIHAEGYASAELKHGVIALIQKGIPCFVLADQDTNLEVLSSAMEMKARGGYIIGVATENNAVFDAFIKIPSRPTDLSIVYAVVVGQLFGYFLGLSRGADPDKPRNLAKSVTVK